MTHAWHAQNELAAEPEYQLAVVVREVEDVDVGMPRRRREAAEKSGRDVARASRSPASGLMLINPPSGPGSDDAVLAATPYLVSNRAAWDREKVACWSPDRLT